MIHYDWFIYGLNLIISRDILESNWSSSSVSKLSLNIKEIWIQRPGTAQPRFQPLPVSNDSTCWHAAHVSAVFGDLLCDSGSVFFTSYLLLDSCSCFSSCSFLISAALLKPFGPRPFDGDLAIHSFSGQICSFSCGRHVFTLRVVWLEIIMLMMWWCTGVHKTDETFWLVNKYYYFSCNFILEGLKLVPST